MKALMPRLFAAALLAASPCLAPAQTGPALILVPWEKLGDDREARVELGASAGFYIGDADIDNTNHELGLSIWGGKGRAKLSERAGAGPAVGFDALQLQLDTEDPALPQRLADHSAAVAWGWELDGDWDMGVVAGAGYAGTRPFDDGDSIYFLGDILFSRSIDDRSSISLGVNYHGNRNIFPDVPLPSVSYSRRSEVQGLRYTVGFPFSTISYEPDDRWSFEMGYTLPLSFRARAGYRVAQSLSLFAEYDTFTRGFWIEDDPSDNDRIFFTQQRIEVGLRYEAVTGMDLIAATGYAFGQEFQVGWDTRDTDDLRDVDAAPYVRIGVSLAF